MGRFSFDARELAGAVADVGVLVPIAVVLIVANGLSATAVVLPAGLLYLTAALVYRLPIPVQPLKAFGAIAIARGLGADVIACGALLMGVIFLSLGRSGLVDRVAKAFPRPVIRGVQLTVGLLFLKIAWGLVDHPSHAFAGQAAAGAWWVVPAAGALLALSLVLRRRLVTLALVAVGLGAAFGDGAALAFGPSAIELPAIDWHSLETAFVVLVVPQVPLTFANSCLATADAARTYFRERADRVAPGRLATTLGIANLFSGAISGMPVCHGAGGLTAHYSFGARTGGAPLMLGSALVVLALAAGAGLASLLAAFPLPILAGLLAAAGVLHIGLLRDLRGPEAWAVALGVGAVGFAYNLAVALGIGLAAWWLQRLTERALRRRGLRATS
jgi:hypothetical protein